MKMDKQVEENLQRSIEQVLASHAQRGLDIGCPYDRARISCAISEVFYTVLKKQLDPIMRKGKNG